MRKMAFAITVAVVAFAVPALLAGPAEPLTLNWGTHVDAASCDSSGPPVINVTMKVANDVDSGQAGNYWAFDNYTKTVQVWPQADGTYCAIVRYVGQFVAQAGQTTPGNTGTFATNDFGTFKGGYVATIDGALLANPAWKTRGNVGTIDFGCDISGLCPGRVSWVDHYFQGGYSFAYDWWGWIYRDGKDAWTNSVDGSAGDIN